MKIASPSRHSSLTLTTTCYKNQIRKATICGQLGFGLLPQHNQLNTHAHTLTNMPPLLPHVSRCCNKNASTHWTKHEPKTHYGLNRIATVFPHCLLASTSPPSLATQKTVDVATFLLSLTSFFYAAFSHFNAAAAASISRRQAVA